ncbi:MAG TPA: hypothetical protein EYM39_03670 [Candidatus Latescibacteria bacterium]|nr:hypothetical protein [Candidatus Latescibacterota bacterium]
MTGTTAKTHGDRVFKEHLEMDPALPTMPQVFRDAGYQAFAVGELHVYPQRDRIGFDEVILCEEGRHHLGGDEDDFERFLKAEGCAGQELTHAMGNNVYDTRPWHLPGPHAAGLLVLLLHRSPSAGGSAQGLLRSVPSPLRGRAL